MFLIIFFFTIISVKSKILNEGVNYTDIEYSGIYNIFKDIAEFDSYSENNGDLYIDTNSSILCSRYANYFNQTFFLRNKVANLYYNLPINDEILFTEQKSIILNKFSMGLDYKLKYKNILINFGFKQSISGFFGIGSGISLNLGTIIDTPLGKLLFKVDNLIGYVSKSSSFLFNDLDSDLDDYINYSGKSKGIFSSKKISTYYSPNVKVGYGNEFLGSDYKIRIALEINNLFCNSPFLDVYYKDYSIYRKVELGIEFLKDTEKLSLNIKVGMKNLKPIFRFKGLISNALHFEYCFHNISIDSLNGEEEIKYFHIFSLGLESTIKDFYI